ncbi:MAG TPA: metallophosphoesterase family protein, partial [Pirellulales bacterium]|nr:metallophosphoesterase family protein [Pirellulales bacterium]
MLVGVISDTHGHVEFTRSAVRMFESCAVELVIHCGDIGSNEIVGLFALWPAHFVFGNVDHDQRGL